MNSILNARLVDVTLDPDIRRWLEEIMPRPAFPSHERLVEQGLVYLPFLAVDVLDLSHNIYCLWADAFNQGLIAVEDAYGEDIGNPRNRFRNATRVYFGNESDFRAGGFLDRLFILLNEDEFLYFDFLESSGVCCKADKVEKLLGKRRIHHFLELHELSERVEDESERAYYHRLIDNAAASFSD